MLLIHCPYCDETLPEMEFVYAGEAHIARPVDPNAVNDDDWRDYLFVRSNVRGPHAERWRHAHGCGCFFNAVRDTVTDRVLATYPADAPRPDLSETVAGT